MKAQASRRAEGSQASRRADISKPRGELRERKPRGELTQASLAASYEQKQALRRAMNTRKILELT